MVLLPYDKGSVRVMLGRPHLDYDLRGVAKSPWTRRSAPQSHLASPSSRGTADFEGFQTANKHSEGLVLLQKPP